jgi:hypothetical protein
MKLMGGRRTLRPPPPPGRPDILGYGIWIWVAAVRVGGVGAGDGTRQVVSGE